jgi:hypothetical protein
MPATKKAAKKKVSEPKRGYESKIRSLILKKMEAAGDTVSSLGDKLDVYKVPLYAFLTKGKSIRIDRLEAILEHYKITVK